MDFEKKIREELAQSIQKEIDSKKKKMLDSETQQK